MLCIHSTAPRDTSSVFTSVSELVVKGRSLLVPLVIRRDQRCDLLGFLSAGKFSGSSACISPETSPDHNHTRGSRFCRQPVWRVRHFTTGCIDEKNKHRSADTRRLDGKVLGHKKSTRTMARATGTRKRTKQPLTATSFSQTVAGTSSREFSVGYVPWEHGVAPVVCCR